jgi:hypothetical protein
MQTNHWRYRYPSIAHDHKADAHKTGLVDHEARSGEPQPSRKDFGEKRRNWQRPAKISSNEGLSLWAAETEIALRAEDITVKACHPLPSARGDVQVLNCGLNVWRNALPIKLRI